MTKIDVHDHGYVRLIEGMGSDLTVVNTARTSFAKESLEFTNQDKKLINYLIKHKHDSCLRHCVMTFEVYAPLMVARQWYKHVVASSHVDDQLGWNESSRRYITENEEFYVPDNFLNAPENKKQGAGDPLPEDQNDSWRNKLTVHQNKGHELYLEAMDAGIAPEQARLFLPAYGMYVRWRWTASLNAVMNFLALRLDGHAQSEIRDYAAVVEQHVNQTFPITYEAWKTHR